MKKLMVTLAAVAFAAAAHAATVNWSSGAVLGDSGDGTGWGSAKIAKSSSNYMMTVLVFATYDAVGGLSDQIGTGSWTGTSAKSKLDGSSDTGATALVAGTKYYVQATIENSANNSQLISQILEFTWDGSMEDPKIDFMSSSAGTGVSTLTSMDGTFNATYGYWDAGGWTAAVPEPTSGLLVLLGVAGLALRRRRA